MNFGLLAVYFFYGLAFLGMGLAMALEAQRSPAIAEKRILNLLAVFGIIHGIHEWWESYLLQAQAAGTPQPDWLPWLRQVLLAASFLPLLAYGIRTFRLPSYRPFIGQHIGMGCIGLYSAGILLSAVITYDRNTVPWLVLSDVLGRYLLAVPGAAMAALALRFQVYLAIKEDRPRLASYLTWAVIGFAVYGLTQLVTSPAEMFPSNYLNTVNFRTWMGFPIQVVRTLTAVIITFGLVRAAQVTEEERQKELASAQQARLEALERVQEELSKREALRRELLRNTIRAQEDERARIARELHDETAQILSAATLDLATLHRTLKDDVRTVKLVERLQELAKQMAQGLYRLVHDLRPAQLDDLGLVPALGYLRESSTAKGLQTSLQVQGEIRRLHSVVETALFRVAQEAITNVTRHAQTQAAQISLELGKDYVRLFVSDQGNGFDPAESFTPPRGWGLAGMRERVEALDGTLRIQSAVGQGTIIEAVIPVIGVEGGVDENNPLDVGG